MFLWGRKKCKTIQNHSSATFLWALNIIEILINWVGKGERNWKLGRNKLSGDDKKTVLIKSALIYKVWQTIPLLDFVQILHGWL